MKIKIKNKLKNIIIASLYLHSQIAIAGESTYVNSAQNSIMNNELAYEKCPLVDQTYFVFESGQRVTKTRQIEEPACVARNQEKSRVRGMANSGLQTANALNSGNSDSIVKPTQPADPQCGTETDSQTGRYNFAYSQCMQNYRNQMTEYNRLMTVYNTAMESQQQSRMQADKAQADAEAKMNNTSATGSMSEIQAKNESASKKYAVAGALAAGVAVAWYTKAQFCAGTCAAFGTGCCGWVPVLVATGAAYMLLNGMAKKQSAQHDQSAFAACTTYNQLSTDKKECSASGPQVNVQIDPGTGKCAAGSDPECDKYLNDSGIKVPVTTNSGKTNKMAGSEISKMATLLPDGKVKDKNGKVWSMSDFADKKSMMAAGLSAADAGKLFDELYGKGGPLGKNGLFSAKDALKEDSSKKTSFGGLGLSLGGTNVVDVNKNEGSQNKVFKDNLKEIENRKPSSEGLAREYNGEMIGVAGDDIFLMMNKRYKFKNEQDSFISAEAAH